MKFFSFAKNNPPPPRDFRAEYEAKFREHQEAEDIHILSGYNSEDVLCGKTREWLKEHQPSGATCNPWLTTLSYTFASDFYADSRIPMATCPECRKAWASLRQKAVGR